MSADMKPRYHETGSFYISTEEIRRRLYTYNVWPIQIVVQESCDLMDLVKK